MEGIVGMDNVARIETRLPAPQSGIRSRSLRASPIRPIPRTGVLPLSLGQERLWFTEQLDPGHPAYGLIRTIHLPEPLDIAVLEQTLSEIVRRHEVLRTTFPSLRGRPHQKIGPAQAVTLPVEDLRHLPETGSLAEVQRLALEEVHRPFDLSAGPLWRAKLLHISETESLLLLSMHTMICDRWSVAVFRHELTTIYEAFSVGEPSPLPSLPIQLADWAHGQRLQLRGDGLVPDLDYWKRQLAGDLPVLRVGTDRPRPPRRGQPDAHCVLGLSPALTEELRTLSQNENASLFMTLLAVYQILLSRTSGQEDFMVGSPIAGREQLGTQNLIGNLSNMLVLRADLSGSPTFRELVGRTRQVVAGAYAHRAIPFERLVEELQPERDLSRPPLVQVGLTLFDSTESYVSLPSATADAAMVPVRYSGLDLILEICEEEDGGLGLDLVYNPELFDHARMVEILGQFQHLLAQAAEHPESPIGEYSLVSASARRLLPDPRMALPEPWQEPLPLLFASWMDRDPDPPAIQAGGVTWTYAELARRAHQLAQMLVRSGVEKGTVVAVSGTRSFGLLASMVGVIWSGGVLLNLDRSLPASQQQLMLRESKASCVLYAGAPSQAQDWLRGQLPLIYVEPESGGAVDPAGTAAPQEATDLPEVTPNDPAYLFFTSGSTGVPKGVLGSHKGLSHFLKWQRQTFGIGPQDRCAQLTGLSFDVVLRDIFTPLTGGATLCIPDEGALLDPASLLPWMERERISVIHTVPSLAQVWLKGTPPGISLRTLRWVFMAGEPLSEKLVRKWRQAFPDSGEIINLYGPTETTLAKCYFQVPGEPLPGVQPVGWPMSETQALVLAENNRLCGIGEPGQIVIRTPFRSLGYVNASQENRRRFVKNPYRDDDQDVIYYTGDRGRYRPDGSLDILGRVDHQVKLRGVRIELGGIETVLGEHPAVWQTVVLLREDSPGEKRLVAYVVVKPDQDPKSADLRQFLKQKLPDPMVPSAFVFLETLPLTANGKVNRRALPAPDRARPDLEPTFVTPRTPVEEVLAGIWAEILDVHPVGIHDDFFELGGHSLLATQVISSVRDTLLVELPLRALFDHPTVAGLAESVETVRWMSQSSHAFSDSSDGLMEEGEL
jgi:amino acid adenylation domain-containing protein